MADTKRFRDTSTLTMILKGFLVVYCLLSAAGIWSDWLEIRLLHRMSDGVEVTAEEADSNDSRQFVLAMAGLAVYLMTAIVFLRWVYCSNRNASSLVDDKLEFTPGWAVGWYFVPFANLWKPYQVMAEIFKASHPDFVNDWTSASAPSVTSRWWTLWILGNIIARVQSRMSMKAETLDELLRATQVTLASEVLSVVLGITAITLVKKVHAWQHEKHEIIATATTESL